MDPDSDSYKTEDTLNFSEEEHVSHEDNTRGGFFAFLPKNTVLKVVAAVFVLLVVGGGVSFWLAGNTGSMQRVTIESERDSKSGSLQQSDSVKIVAPKEGMYLGQTTFSGNEVALFEHAIGRKAAINARVGVVSGMEDVETDELNFDVAKAQELWDSGYVFYVGAYEATPGHSSFTTDKLLRGAYDEDLKQLASQFKEFGKPMFFHTAREPNGVLLRYFGGFGKNGDKTSAWAEQNGRGLSEFTPPPAPPGNPDLYKGLGNNQVCDGIERLAAAQRYYYDFFVRREGIDFLTFETMGWLSTNSLDEEPADSIFVQCSDFSQFYNLIADYSDWVSINLYGYTPVDQGGNGALESLMSEIRSVAPGKPVLITELGFCDADERKKASNLKSGMSALVERFPEIKGFTMWVSSNFGEALNCQIQPDTPAGDALKRVIQDNSNSFHSCVRFSDGSTIPNCSTSAVTPLGNITSEGG